MLALKRAVERHIDLGVVTSRRALRRKATSRKVCIEAATGAVRLLALAQSPTRAC